MKRKLMLGDCLEKMKKIPTCVIDLTVTSPPYDNLRTYEDSLEWGPHVWKAVLGELYRVTKQGGVVVWVVGDATIDGGETGTSFRQALFAMGCGFRLHDTMIYNRKTVPLTHNRYEQAFEFMFIFSKGKPLTVNHIKVPCKQAGVDKGQVGKNRQSHIPKNTVIRDTRIKGNVWEYAVGGKVVDHPAVFPEKLAENHILSWSNQGDTVFDPFMGSGTTGIMAIKNKRHFVGIEKVHVYFQLAKERIDQESKRNRGFFDK